MVSSRDATSEGRIVSTYLDASRSCERDTIRMMVSLQYFRHGKYHFEDPVREALWLAAIIH